MSNIFKNTIILIVSLFMINSSFAIAAPLSNKTIKSSLAVNNLTDTCIKYICTSSAANEELKNAGFTCEDKTLYESYSKLELGLLASTPFISLLVGIISYCVCFKECCWNLKHKNVFTYDALKL